MFTVMFAIGRLPGWIAQWKEMRENNEPIGRPRQVYTGYTSRDYVTIDKRKKLIKITIKKGRHIRRPFFIFVPWLTNR